MIPNNNEYYNGSGTCTIKNGIKIIQGEVNCIKPNNINHVSFLYYNSLECITSTNIMHLSYNADINNSSKIAIKCEWNNIHAAFGTAGNRYNFTCVAI